MPALTVKNIPEELYEKLKVAANAHHRSLNSEIIYCLETVLSPRKVSVAERLQRARAMRPKATVSAGEIRRAIDKGRG